MFFLTADRQFQNGRRVKNGRPQCFCALYSLTGQRKWWPYGGFSLNGEFFRHRNALNIFNAFLWAKKLTVMRTSSIQPPFPLPGKRGKGAKTQPTAILEPPISCS